MRKKKNRRLLPLVAGLMSIALVGAACGGDNGDDAAGNGGGNGGEDQKDLTIGYINWDENIALAHLFQSELNKRGYNVEITELQAAALFQSVANGETDLFQDVWLPTTHEDYWEKFEDEVENLGTWYEGATLNIAVPEYVDEVDSIPDLKDHAELFDGEIIGIDPGAGLMRRTEEHAMPGYDLEDSMELITSSTPSMLAELDSAIKAEEPIVVTLWHPHWAYARYDLKDLEDPEGHMGAGEELVNIGRKGFREDYPKLAEVIENFKMDDDTLASLEDAIEEADSPDPTEAVEQWAEENSDLMEEYFGSL